MRKKKVLFFINTLRFGGAERVVSMMVNHLKDDYEIHLALFHKEIAFPVSEDIVLVDLKENPSTGNSLMLLRLPLIARKLSKYCKATEIELVISFLNRPSYVTAFMKSCWGFKGKIIMCERSYQSQMLNYITSSSYSYRFITKKLIHFAYQRANIIISNSIISKEDLQNNFAITTPIEVIYNPVDIAAIQQMSREPKPDCFSDAGAFYFIAIGNFRAEKNFGLLLQSFSLIQPLINAKLIFVGSGALENTQKMLAHKLGINDHVIFCGFQQNPYKFISNANCLVLSSYTEGFPNVLLEALACSKTIVSTDCLSGPRELLAPSSLPSQQVKEGIEVADFGILTAVNNSKALAEGMMKAYSDKTLRSSFEIKAIERAAVFNINININQYRQVIDNILQISTKH